MRAVAICGKKMKDTQPYNDSLSTIEMDGVAVTCGLIHSQDVDFDPAAEEHADSVLLQVKAFSCNYRDKSLIFLMATSKADYNYYVVGSEFMGDVVSTGHRVKTLQVGDRVIGNGSYPHADVVDVPGGLPTNHASKEYQILHHAKLIKIPPEMPHDVAAAFSIGGQTTYSMIRRLGITAGANVLVTAARSNTSLFAINALSKHHVNVYATTTSAHFEAQFHQMNVKELIPIDPQADSFADNATMDQIIKAIGGFDYVIDPFFDLHIGKVIEVMNYGARYITCGLYDQYLERIGQHFPYPRVRCSAVLSAVMRKNLHIIGNCIGVSDDLQQALDDYASGALPVVMDSVFYGKDVGPFFERTYNASDRFGKVVYSYD